MEKFRSRKFILAAGVQAGLFLLLYQGTLDVETFKEMTQFTLAGYLGANVIQKATAKIGDLP